MSPNKHNLGYDSRCYYCRIIDRTALVIAVIVVILFLRAGLLLSIFIIALGYGARFLARKIPMTHGFFITFEDNNDLNSREGAE